MAFKKGLSVLNEQEKIRSGIIGIAFLMIVYTIYKHWLGIFCEARFLEPLSDISCKIIAVLPGIKLPMLLILGILLFLDRIRNYLSFLAMLNPAPKGR